MVHLGLYTTLASQYTQILIAHSQPRPPQHSLCTRPGYRQSIDLYHKRSGQGHAKHARTRRAPGRWPLHPNTTTADPACCYSNLGKSHNCRRTHECSQNACHAHAYAHSRGKGSGAKPTRDPGIRARIRGRGVDWGDPALFLQTKPFACFRSLRMDQDWTGRVRCVLLDFQAENTRCKASHPTSESPRPIPHAGDRL